MKYPTSWNVFHFEIKPAKSFRSSSYLSRIKVAHFKKLTLIDGIWKSALLWKRRAPRPTTSIFISRITASRKTGFPYVLLTWHPSREIPGFLQRVSITRSFRPTSSVNRRSALFPHFTDDYGRVYPRIRTPIAAGEHLSCNMLFFVCRIFDWCFFKF